MFSFCSFVKPGVGLNQKARGNTHLAWVRQHRRTVMEGPAMWPILKAAECNAGIRQLTDDETKAIAGGETTSATARKAGKGQQDFLVVTMSDILISSY
jgi:hypothetical protein